MRRTSDSRCPTARAPGCQRWTTYGTRQRDEKAYRGSDLVQRGEPPICDLQVAIVPLYVGLDGDDEPAVGVFFCELDGPAHGLVHGDEFRETQGQINGLYLAGSRVILRKGRRWIDLPLRLWISEQGTPGTSSKRDAGRRRADTD